MKAYRAGKPVPKPGIQEERCGNRMPHTCRDGSRRNSIPDGSPIPSCSRAGNNDACSGRKDSRSPYNRKFVFSVAVRQCGQGYRHRQVPDAPDGSVLCGWIDPETGVCKAGK